MAIVKTVTSQYGVDATYWRITELIHSVVTEQATIHLDGYATKQARLDGANPLVHYQYTVEDVVDILNGDDATRTLAYGWIKNLPEWFGATDDV